MGHPNTASSEKKAFWQSHMQQWRDSGLSQADYCAQHRLKIYQFHYWRGKLRAKSTKAESSPRLVELETKTDWNAPVRPERVYPLKIHVGKAVIEVGSDMPPETLRQFVKALEA